MNSISDICLRLNHNEVRISEIVFSTVLVCGVAIAALGLSAIFLNQVIKTPFSLKITAPAIALGSSFAAVATFGLKSVSKKFKESEKSKAFYEEFMGAQILHYMPDYSVVTMSTIGRVGYEGEIMGYTHLKHKDKKIYFLDFLKPYPEKDILSLGPPGNWSRVEQSLPKIGWEIEKSTWNKDITQNSIVIVLLQPKDRSTFGAEGTMEAGFIQAGGKIVGIPYTKRSPFFKDLMAHQILDLIAEK